MRRAPNAYETLQRGRALQRAILQRPIPFGWQGRFDAAVKQLDDGERQLVAGNGELGIAPLAALGVVLFAAFSSLVIVYTKQAADAGDTLKKAVEKGIEKVGDGASTVVVWCLAIWGIGVARKSWTKPARRKARAA